jgi:hypothetical protein
MPYVGSPPPSRNGFDSGYAWKLTCLVDEELRRMQDTGWRLSHSRDARFESLLKQQRIASETGNMAAYVHVYREILSLCRDDYARWQRRRLADDADTPEETTGSDASTDEPEPPRHPST